MYRLNSKIRLTMLSGFELHSRWVPLNHLVDLDGTRVMHVIAICVYVNCL